MPTAAEILKLKNISTAQSPPVPGFELEPLPVEIIRAFPKMEDWRKKQNKRFADYTLKVNTTLRP